MIPTAFDYVSAGSVDEALAALAEHGDEAKVLAGGHSLIPLMRFRLAAPAVLVDIGRLDDLAGVHDGGDHLEIGAMTRHHVVEDDPTIRAQVPVLAAATHEVGDPQVRRRGTIGGAVVHGDPAGDLPAVLLALDATMVVDGPSGRRTVAAADFFTGFLETAVQPDELLTAIRVPKVPDAGWSFQKFNRRAQDWAIVGVACVAPADGEAAIGLVNMHTTPVRATAAEQALVSGVGDATAAEAAGEGVDPPSDGNATAEFRRHLARVLTGRALDEARQRRG